MVCGIERNIENQIPNGNLLVGKRNKTNQDPRTRKKRRGKRRKSGTLAFSETFF